MASSRVSIQCYHCNKRTVIDLEEEMSTQRCQKCGLRLSSVNTSSTQKRRKRVSGDPMIKRYQASENPSIFRKKRRRFGDPRLRFFKLMLLLLFFGIIAATCIIVLKNPTGVKGVP
jgi:hypothetical protein